MNESAFFQDLAVLTALVGFVAFIFARLGWPKVMGYILVGVLMNQHTWGGDFLTDTTSIQTLGQLGIVFLMFGMGLNFSAKDMRKIQFVALPAALVDVVVMIWLGHTVGTRIFHWESLPSLFLGVAMCDSATTLLAKVFDEMGWSKRPFTKYVLGTSICEDIMCVGAIAVVTGCAHGGGMSFLALTKSLGALGIFFVAVLIFGLILVPKLLRAMERRHDTEALILVILGCCFLVSYLAYKFEFSLAMGAFLVGLLGATSELRSKLDALVEPLKALFSAMFFVTIGLLVNPKALWTCWPQILIVSLFVIGGKFINITTMSLVTGQNIKSSIQTGMSLAQIGEFAFMTAILYSGLSSHAGDSMFQIAVGASLLTTLLNPAFIKLSEPFGQAADRHLPKGLATVLASYRVWLYTIRQSRDSLAYMLAKRAGQRILIYAALMVAVAIACMQLARFDFTRFSVTFERYDHWIFFAISNLFSVACLPLIVFAARALGDEVAEMLAGEGSVRWRMARVKAIRFVVLIMVLIAFVMEWAMINITITPGLSRFTVLCIVVTSLVLVIFTWRIITHFGRKILHNFRTEIVSDDRH